MMNWKIWSLAVLLLAIAPGAALADGVVCHGGGICPGEADTTETPKPPQQDPCLDENGDPKVQCQCPPVAEEGVPNTEPISPVSGRLFMVETDLVVKGVYPIELVRRYSSHSDYDSPLGYGWAFTYDMQLFDYTGGAAQDEVLIRSTCGVRTRYTQNPDTTFSAPAGSRSTLAVDGSGWRLTYPGGRKVLFTSLGLVDALEDPQGNRLEFKYEEVSGEPAKFDLVGTSPFASDPTEPHVVAQQYRIQTISERLSGGQLTGRTVTFVYDTNGRLTTATSHDGRIVTYVPEVDGTTVTGNLASVIGLEGITSTYTYTDPAPTNTGAVPQTPYLHNLTGMILGQGMTPWETEYDARDRVVEQRRGAREVAFDYTVAGETTVNRTVAGDSAPYVVQTVYAYDAGGLITSITDALNQTQVFSRIAPGGPHPAKTGLYDVVEVIDAAQKVKRRTEYGYSDDGFVTSQATYLDFDANGEIDTNGRTITETFAWDQGWLTSREVVASDEPGKVFRTTFDFYRDHLPPTDGSYDPNEAITNIYSIARWNNVEQVDETTLMEYAPETRQISRVQFPDGHQIDRTYYAWDAGTGRAGMGHETYHIDSGTSQPDPFLRVSWDYDVAGNLASVTDARGIATPGIADDYETLLTWDQRGRVTAIQNPLGETTTFTFTAPTFGSPPTDPLSADPGKSASLVERSNGVATQRSRFHQDGDGNLRLIERHDGTGWGTLESSTWDSDDRLLSQTQTRGFGGPDELTTYAYDLLGRLETITEVLEPGAPPVTTIAKFGYDVAGNRTSAIEAFGVPALETETLFTYDGLDRLLKTQQTGVSPALETDFTYDASGNVKTVEDPRDKITTYTYDTLSRLRSVEQALGQTVSYDWDLRGRLAQINNARGNILKNLYEEWGPLERTEHYADATAAQAGTPLDRTVSYVYDLTGNVSEVRDSDLDPDAVTPGVQPLYTFTYDALNRVDVNTVHYVPGNTVVLDSGYDAFDNRKDLDVTDGGVLYAHDWQFNELDRLSQATFPGSGATLPGAPVDLFFSHYENDDLREITHGNGATTDYAYYANGPIDTVAVEDASSTQLHHLDYTVNERLNLTTIAEEVGTTALSPDWVYDYDGVSRLTAATSYPAVPGVSSLPSSDAFPYDAAGNRDDNPGSGTPWRYNDNNEIEESPDLLYAHDPDGNLCKWVPSGGSITTGCAEGDTDETRFVFDYANRLREIYRPDDGVPGAGTPEVTYRYDPFGRRLEKTVNGVTIWFVWDGDQLLAEYDASGVRTVRYAYAEGFAPVQVVHPNGSGGEDVYEVHVDHLGTPRLLTDSNPSAAWRSYHEAYGRAHIDSPGGLVFNVRFLGQYYDRETEQWDPTLAGGSGGFSERSGLHYNRWRYYDPSAGRYTRYDPIGQASGPNPFLYVANDPLQFTDPLGLVICLASTGPKKDPCKKIRNSRGRGWRAKLAKRIILELCNLFLAGEPDPKPDLPPRPPIERSLPKPPEGPKPPYSIPKTPGSPPTPPGGKGPPD